MISIIGIPFDENSSFLQGSALAPQRIREALHSPSSNAFAENGVDTSASGGWRDVGDMNVASYQAIADGIDTLLDRGDRVISLGGDHSITFPIMQAFGRKYNDLTIVQFDAHCDLYDELDGNRHSHACPFARIMEAGLVKRLVQIGIRTLTTHQKEQAEKFGVEIIEMRHVPDQIDLSFEGSGSVYISLDLDVLDPAFAPGVSHHEPGGLTTRQLITMLQQLEGNLVGADIVELNPHRDPSGLTAMVAAKLLKEILSKML